MNNIERSKQVERELHLVIERLLVNDPGLTVHEVVTALLREAMDVIACAPGEERRRYADDVKREFSDAMDRHFIQRMN